jgi:hypothetical protein
MLLNPHNISLTSGRDVNRYLDEWAEGHLVSPERWRDVLGLTRDWVDYSARNQILLAAHGAVGHVAGIETWRLVPSADGHVCAVRSGEHGLPVRVPVTTGGAEPDPHVGRARPTQAAVAGWEWRAVFCVEQLARRPAAERLIRLPAPEALQGPGGDGRYLDSVQAVAKRTVRGRMPTLDDPATVLAHAAARLPRTDKRPPLDDVLARQVAWLVGERVDRAPGSLPEFDPSGHAPRERWELALDVLDPARKLAAGLGKQFDVDLLGSPLPRMLVDDDRVVAAERRNRLPRATIAQLPVGSWVEVGPYTREEWAARGETASGKGAYLRLNTTAYLAVAEQGERAIWRLEDTRALTGAGILAEGDGESLEHVQGTAIATMRARYPQLAEVSAPPTRHKEEAEQTDEVTIGWEPLPDRPDDEARRLSLDNGVVIYVMPVRDEWLPLVQSGRSGMLRPIGDPTTTRAVAMSAALLAGRRAVREAITETRVDFDASVARLADGSDYTREALVEFVSARLDGPERTALVSDPAPAELVELLGAAGVTAATTVAVLHAESLDAATTAGLLPIVGVPAATGINVLNERWDVDKVTSAELLGASAADMREAGCTPTEIISARPSEIIEHLPADPNLWDLVGGTLASGGHQPNGIAGFLATHAPDPECFAAGITAGIDDPAIGLTVALRRGMPAEAIAATSERYGLSPMNTAVILGDAGAAPHLSVPVLLQRCDGDLTLTAQIARSTLQLRNETVVDALTNVEPVDSADISEMRAARPLSRDRDALIAAHIPPRPASAARSSNATMLLDYLPDPTSNPRVASDSLLDNLPDADDMTTVGNDLLASIPDPELPDHGPHLEITP